MKEFICEMQYCENSTGIIRSARVIHDDFLNKFVLIKSSCKQDSLRPSEEWFEFHDERKVLVAAIKFVYSHLYKNDNHDN